MQGRHRNRAAAATNADNPTARAADGRGGGRGITRNQVLALGSAALLGAAGWFLHGGVSPTELTVVVALLAVGCGAAAALLAVFAARLTPDPQAGWVSMALGCYGLLAVPTSTVAAFDPAPAPRAVSLLADAVVMGLLLIAAVAPPRLSRRRVLVVLLGAALSIVCAAALGEIVPTVVDVVATFVPVSLGLALVWTALGVTVAAQAAGRQAAGLCAVGAGIALLGCARVIRLTDFGEPVIDVGAASSGLRIAAITLVLFGALRLARQALVQLEDQRASMEEELRLAETWLARTAERDHELRNGLAGLAGATTLLGSGCPDPDRLGTAVASELDRLDDLLQSHAPGSSPAPSASYAVAPVLQGLAVLRSSTGMDVRVELEPNLRAVGSSARLAQVVTNLFANVERHAPGSPVQITAQQRDGRIVIRFRDFGPGVAPGTEDEVFRPGVRDEDRGGLGLGLHVCRRLLAADDGTVTLGGAGTGERGCLVEVELAAAPDLPAAPRPFTASQLQNAS